MLTWNGSEVVNMKLARNSPDPATRHLFSAALVSFGALGVIHAVKVKTVEPYSMAVTNTVAYLQDILKNYHKLVYSYDCFMLVIQPENNFKQTIVRTQTYLPDLERYKVAKSNEKDKENTENSENLNVSRDCAFGEQKTETKVI